MTVAIAGTLSGRLQRTAAAHPDRPAVTLGDRTLTYQDLAHAVAACAAGLSELGVGPGQRVAIIFPNCPQFVISYFAALQLGATVVPLHCLQGPAEIMHVIADAGAETLIGLDVFCPLMQAVREHVPTLRRVVVSGEASVPDAHDFAALLQPPSGPVPFHPATPDDLAVLIYTSGTTGRPKGAMLSHDNIVFDADACCEVISVTEQDVFGTVLPLFHSFGATVCMILPILQGAHSVLLPRFSPLTVLETLEAARATVFAGVPSMYAVMLQMKTDREFDLGAMRLAVSGGAPLPVEVLHGFERRFGVYMIEGYGPTEASPVVSVNRLDGTRKIGTVGPPLPGVSVKLVDDEFNEVALGEAGEVCVAGRNVMRGYWNDPERTAETIRDGWLLTGDMGTLDEDGLLSIVDRKKDMIIVGGMNVYPREVEDEILTLAQVADASVVGAPSRLRGEDVVAFIQLKENAQLDADIVIEHCKAHLANYKVPRRVEFRDELPRSFIGKVLKRALRDELVAAARNSEA